MHERNRTYFLKYLDGSSFKKYKIHTYHTHEKSPLLFSIHRPKLWQGSDRQGGPVSISQFLPLYLKIDSDHIEIMLLFVSM